MVFGKVWKFSMENRHIYLLPLHISDINVFDVWVNVAKKYYVSDYFMSTKRAD